MWMIKHRDNFDHFFKHYNPGNVHTGGTIKIHKIRTPDVCINDSETAETGSHRYFAGSNMTSTEKQTEDYQQLPLAVVARVVFEKGGNPG